MGLFDDHNVGRAHLPHPLRQLMDVRYGRGKAHEADVFGREDNALFPHRSPFRIVKIVDLVEHRVVNVAKARGVFQDKVAEDFGGHDEHVGFRINGHVSGVYANGTFAEPLAEVPVFLVRQRLDGGGINDAFAFFYGNVDCVFGDERLSASRGRRNDERPSLVDGGNRLFLKRIEGKT